MSTDQTPTEDVVNPQAGENVAPAAKPELTEEQKAKLSQQKEFFFRLRQGGTFLKFIYNDIERQKKEHLNRAQRRRFEKELRRGTFSRELVDVYLAQITEIQAYIENEMNPKPAVDGAQFLADLRAKEAAGTLTEETPSGT